MLVHLHEKLENHKLNVVIHEYYQYDYLLNHFL